MTKPTEPQILALVYAIEAGGTLDHRANVDRWTGSSLGPHRMVPGVRTDTLLAMHRQGWIGYPVFPNGHNWTSYTVLPAGRELPEVVTRLAERAEQRRAYQNALAEIADDEARIDLEERGARPPVEPIPEPIPEPPPPVFVTEQGEHALCADVSATFLAALVEKPDGYPDRALDAAYAMLVSLLDRAARTWLPAYLDRHGLGAIAERFRELEPILAEEQIKALARMASGCADAILGRQAHRSVVFPEPNTRVCTEGESAAASTLNRLSLTVGWFVNGGVVSLHGAARMLGQFVAQIGAEPEARWAIIVATTRPPSA